MGKGCGLVPINILTGNQTSIVKDGLFPLPPTHTLLSVCGRHCIFLYLCMNGT